MTPNALLLINNAQKMNLWKNQQNRRKARGIKPRKGIKVLIRMGQILSAYLLMQPSLAVENGNADVIAASAIQNSTETWTFSVTISHPDTGWKSYADGWDVLLPNGSVVRPNADEQFTRTLWHPHVNEQPFTRAQSGVVIPAHINDVTIRAHDKPDGFGGETINLNLSVLRNK